MFPGVYILILNRIMIHFLTATSNYIPKVLIITFIAQYNFRKILPITVSRKPRTKISKHTCFLVLFSYFFITHTIFFIKHNSIFSHIIILCISPFISPNEQPSTDYIMYQFIRERSNQCTHLLSFMQVE